MGLVVQRRPVPQRRRFSILRSKIIDKQVITRQEGTSLGFVEQLYVLPQQIAVANINLKQDKLPLTPANRNIPLAALQQIGDVLLVQDESALRQPDPYSAANTTKLVGLDVVTEAGQLLGKVRDFSFSPDTGLLDSIKYDRFGRPLVPPTIVSVFSVPVSDVMRVSFSRVTLANQHQAIRESDGLLDQATAALFQLMSNDDSSMYAGQSPEIIEWEQKYGRQWRAYYGTDPYKELAAARRQPRQLPPPQTQSFRDRLAPQPVARQRAMQPSRAIQPPAAMQQQAYQQQSYEQPPAQSRDPRSRRNAAGPPAASQEYRPRGSSAQRPPSSRQPDGRTADRQLQPAATSPQRQQDSEARRAHPDDMQARQAIADARRQRLRKQESQLQDYGQRTAVPQQQAAAEWPQQRSAPDAGRSWLEYEKNPIRL